MKHIILSNFEGREVLQIKRYDGKGNALHFELLEEINETLTNLIGNDSIKSLIITGSGAYFSSGLDLREITNSDFERVKEYFNLSSEVFFKLFTLPIPTLAAINGHAVAGGAVLTIACDYRIFRAGNYKFGFTGVNIGIPYPLVPLEIIKFVIPTYMIYEMLLQGKLIDPKTCFKKNIVHDLVHGDTDMIGFSQEYLKKNVVAPLQNYKFLKENLHGPIVKKILQNQHSHDKDQFNLFTDTRLQETLRNITRKYKM